MRRKTLACSTTRTYIVPVLHAVPVGNQLNRLTARTSREVADIITSSYEQAQCNEHVVSHNCLLISRRVQYEVSRSLVYTLERMQDILIQAQIPDRPDKIVWGVIPDKE